MAWGAGSTRFASMSQAIAILNGRLQIGDGRMLLMEGARGSTRDYLEDAHLLDLTTLQW